MPWKSVFSYSSVTLADFEAAGSLKLVHNQNNP